LSTPHDGSNVADLALYLRFFLRNSIAVSDLKAQHPRLRDLNLWFRNNFYALGLKTCIFFETQRTHGLHVVNESSADPGIAPISPIPIDANHLNIATPTHYNSIIIGQTLKSFDDAVPSAKYHFQFDILERANVPNPKLDRSSWLRRSKIIIQKIGLKRLLKYCTTMAMSFIVVESAITYFTPGKDKASLYMFAKNYEGTTVWYHEIIPRSPMADMSSFIVTTGEAPVSAVRANIAIPSALAVVFEMQKAETYKMETIRHNDKTNTEEKSDSIQGGPQLIDLEFTVAPEFHGGRVKRVNSISIKTSEGEIATHLSTDKISYTCDVLMTEKCKKNNDPFYMYLSPEIKKQGYNKWNIQVAKFFEIAITFDDGEGGTIVFEIGQTGRHAIYQALRDWGQWLEPTPGIRPRMVPTDRERCITRTAPFDRKSHMDELGNSRAGCDAPHL
jgi:hypothetical protein